MSGRYRLVFTWSLKKEIVCCYQPFLWIHNPIYISFALDSFESRLYATPFYATPFYATPKYATPFYATPKYATPKYATPLYATPKYATPLYTLRSSLFYFHNVLCPTQIK